MAESPLTHPLAYLRHTHGWGVAEFARLMQDHGARLGVPLATNRTTVWKWEHGQTPDRDAQYVLADLLGVPATDAAPDLWPAWLPVWEVAALNAPWTLPGTVAAVEDLVRSARMDRRGFLTITGVSLTALAMSWAAAPSAFAAAAGGDRVTDNMLADLELRVGTLRSLDDQMGGARLLEQAHGDLALITSLIRHARYTDAVGARLHSLAAQVAYLTGWMAYDSGLHSAGQQYYVAALRASRTAGDGDLGAFLLAEMGVHASDGGYNRERASLLRTALDQTPGTVPLVTRAYLYLHLAAALAQQQEHREAASALHRSVTLWDRTNDERGQWLKWFGESQINSTKGKVLLWAGRSEEATDFLAASVSTAVPRDQAVRAGRLAEAHLAGGDLDGALVAANHGIALLEQRVASNRAVQRLHAFSGKLDRYGKEPAVREFRDRLKALPELAAA
ncbi:transcriptional regulator [Streptomyces sp. KK5PA1]|uniref:Transcriptional regulator n=2 Tax=Actinacidiphila acididurans TaxID=2784346 RepID=A0ABS2TXL0_9ACTN|nr:transcriptional regulator [Actinacidiphila acididurans]